MPFPVMPSPGDIRTATRTSTGTAITVPAGRVFCYDINIANSINLVGSNTTTVTWNGAGAPEPVSGTTLLGCVAQGTALTTAATNTAYITGVVRAGASDCTIDVTVGASGQATATISGYLL